MIVYANFEISFHGLQFSSLDEVRALEDQLREFARGLGDFDVYVELTETAGTEETT